MCIMRLVPPSHVLPAAEQPRGRTDEVRTNERQAGQDGSRQVKIPAQVGVFLPPVRQSAISKREAGRVCAEGGNHSR